MADAQDVHADVEFMEKERRIADDKKIDEMYGI